MGINTLTDGTGRLKSIIEKLSDKERDELLDLLEQDKREREESNEIRLYKENLRNRLRHHDQVVLKNLKDNFIKVEEDKEMLGYKGKILHIDLPAVGKFKGYKFECFISDEVVEKKLFEENPEFEKKLYSIKEIGCLLKAFNRYMKECGINTDDFIDYERKLKYWNTEKTACVVGDMLRLVVVGIDESYNWLKEKKVGGEDDLRAVWDFNSLDGYCYFGYLPDNFVDAKLLLKL